MLAWLIFMLIICGPTAWILWDSMRRYGRPSSILAVLSPLTMHGAAVIYLVRRWLRPAPEHPPATLMQDKLLAACVLIVITLPSAIFAALYEPSEVTAQNTPAATPRALTKQETAQKKKEADATKARAAKEALAAKAKAAKVAVEAKKQAAAEALAEKKRQAQEDRERAQVAAEQRRQRRKNPRLYALMDKYGEELGRNLYERRVGVGTTEAQMRDALGRPERINRTTNSFGTTEQWVYGIGFYVYMQNGICTTIQDVR